MENSMACGDVQDMFGAGSSVIRRTTVEVERLGDIKLDQRRSPDGKDPTLSSYSGMSCMAT